VHAVVSDDTQMSLAVWRALGESEPVGAFVDEFLAWRVDPDNTRAPGNTCLSALGAIAAGASWLEATVLGSKGCGTVMRAPWIGLTPA
jgi:ADP-ribosylglycohydrolase